jgi:hypothetical protein
MVRLPVPVRDRAVVPLVISFRIDRRQQARARHQGPGLAAPVWAIHPALATDLRPYPVIDPALVTHPAWNDLSPDPANGRV